MKRLSIALILSVGAASPAFAHLNPAEHGSFAAGFSHPLFGADHILAMVGVGLWAFLVGGIFPASLLYSAGTPRFIGSTGTLLFPFCAKAGFFFTNANGGWEFPAFWTIGLLVLFLLGDGALTLAATPALF